MKKVFQKIVINCCIAVLVAMTFLLPGWLFQLFHEARFIWFSPKYFGIFFVFGFFVAGSRSYATIVAVFAGLGVLEITQFSSLAYFGEFLTPYAIGQMFIESVDVSEAVIASFSHLSYVLLVVLLPYSICLYLLHLLWPHALKIRFFTLLVLLTLIFPAIRVNVHSDHKDIHKFFPVVTTPSLANTLNSYSLWLTRLLPKTLMSSEGTTFLPIQVKPKPVANKITVVVVMGESFSANRMSLFNHNRQTTPRLDALASDPDFVFTKGYSAANATRSSLPMFFNVQYHPLNRGLMRQQPTNLFRLAKDNGFKTIYISAQKANCLNGVNTGAIDHLVTYDTKPRIFDRLKDEALLALIDQVELGPRNFIVLHQRNAHAPYETNYQQRPEFGRYPTDNVSHREFLKNSYDNAMLYNDFLLTGIISYFKSRPGGPVYIFITSDHGEEFGEYGVWGHDHLSFNSALVPMLFYGVNADQRFIERFAALHMPTHYELGRLIADRLGYEIINPNEEEGVFYVNGVASYGMSGYMRLRKSDNEEPAELQIFH